MASLRLQSRIVLVRPRNPLNLLAAARAAANFGFDDVVVVSPYPPTWEEACAVRESGKWLRKARRVGSLLDAIEDRNWVLGTSSLARRNVDPARVVSLDELATTSVRSKNRDRMAILFGSEKRGLSNQDLDLCHAVVRIPTTSMTASMNLGQAVAVCCYELQRSLRLRDPVEIVGPAAASVGEIVRLVEELGRILTVNATSGSGKEVMHRKREARMRNMLLRLSPSSEEVALALGVVRDLAWRLRQAK